MTDLIDPIPLLNEIERREQVVNLLAVESGSRAWGFPSPDSDWDVRFVYARTTRWHLTLHKGRDVIERQFPGDIDMAGWDLRKTMGLVLKGNCAIREWLASPITYYSDYDVVSEIAEIATMVPARRASRYHYTSLIRKVRADYLVGEEVKLKKYFYAIRPALCLRWLAELDDGKTLPPIDISALIDETPVSDAEMEAIATLMEQKREASEMGMGKRIPVIDAMIEAEEAKALAAMAEIEEEPVSAEAVERANALLIKAAQAADLWYPE